MIEVIIFIIIDFSYVVMIAITEGFLDILLSPTLKIKHE